MNFQRRRLLFKARELRQGGPEAAVPSPCMSVCRMQGEVCEGCLRTLDEIAAWSTMPDADKLDVWALIETRASQEPA